MKKFFREVVFDEDFQLVNSSNILLSKKSINFHLSEYNSFLQRNHPEDMSCKLDVPISLTPNITLLYSYLLNGRLCYRGFEEFQYI